MLGNALGRAKARAARLLQRSHRRGDTLPSLRDLPRAIEGLRIPRGAARIPGWLSDDECRALYALGFHLPGPFLEVGP